MKYLVVQAYWYLEQFSGEFHHRIGRPGEMLARHPEFTVRHVHIYHPLFAQLALSADLLILHLVADDEVKQIIQMRKKMGKATLYEIPDNFLRLGPWVAASDALRNPLVRQNILSAARACEAVQFSSSELLEVFGEVNARHQVFENQIDHFAAPREMDRFVFGWGGSLGHMRDLERFTPAIRKFCLDFPEVGFAFMGDRTVFDRLFGFLPNAEYHEPGPVKSYYRFLRKLTVGIAPLEDNSFNRCRSDVKFLEYAAHGAAPVLADVACYRRHGRDNETCLFFKDVPGLYEALNRLRQDSALTLSLAKNAYQYARVKRSLSNHIDRRIAFYRSFLTFEPSMPDVPEVPSCAGLIALIHKAGLLYEACELHAAIEVLEETLSQHPNYYQAHMLRLKSLVRFGLHRAAIDGYRYYECSPIYWDVLYQNLTRAGQALGDEVWREFHRRIADPEMRTALNYNRSLNNERKFRRLLKINPYHYEALVNLGLLLAHRSNGQEEAMAMFRRAEFLNPEELKLAEFGM